MRATRQTLSPSVLVKHGEAMSAAFLSHARLSSQQNIALYIAQKGEMDTSVLIQVLQKRGKRLFLPVLHPSHPQKLAFIETRPGQKMTKNRFGIPEPEYQREWQIDVQQLDLILVPLLAFDAHGNRLGMGGGFYDRSLAPIKHKAKPLRIGLAHACQQTDHLNSEPWDVSLHGIISEQGLQLFNSEDT